MFPQVIDNTAVFRVGVGEVASSNLVVPTIFLNNLAVRESPNGAKSGATKGHYAAVALWELWLELPMNIAAMVS
jgi:hypothetical protein